MLTLFDFFLILFSLENKVLFNFMYIKTEIDFRDLVRTHSNVLHTQFQECVPAKFQWLHSVTYTSESIIQFCSSKITCQVILYGQQLRPFYITHTDLLNTLEKTLVELWLSAEVGSESPCEPCDPCEPWLAAVPSPVRPSTQERGQESLFSIWGRMMIRAIKNISGHRNFNAL